MNEKDTWANEILQSLEGIQKASPSDDLFAKIMEQIPEAIPTNIIPLKRLGWIAVAACFLIGINVYVFDLGTTNNIKTQSTQQYDKLMTDYSLYN